MKCINLITSLTLAATIGLATAVSHAQGLIAIDGSSTVFPITEAVAEEFQKANKQTRVTVGISGTGGGFKKFCRNETSIQNASRPISASEMQACKQNNVKYLELPVAFDALTIVVNKQNTWAQCIKIEELRTIWEPSAQDRLANWNQVRPDWPIRKITLYGAGSDSGTFDYFTEAVMGKAKSSRSDYMASEDDNVLVQGISKDANALGYLPLSYVIAHQKHLTSVSVWNGQKCVEPTSANVVNGSYIPFGRPLFIYVNVQHLQQAHVQKFVDYFISDQGQKLILEVKYVPLPSFAYDQVRNRIKLKQSGTAFDGHSQMGMDVQTILNKTPIE